MQREDKEVETALWLSYLAELQEVDGLHKNGVIRDWNSRIR